MSPRFSCQNCGTEIRKTACAASVEVPIGETNFSVMNTYCGTCENCVCEVCHKCVGDFKPHCTCVVTIPAPDEIYHEDIIERLREILSDLNYETYQCVCCQWIDHDESKWYKCHKCDDPICEQCYKDFGKESKKIICWECAE